LHDGHIPASHRVGDIDVAYRIAGRGKAVVLVHPRLRPADVVSPAAQNCPIVHTVITYDLRGHAIANTCRDDPTAIRRPSRPRSLRL